MEVNGDGLFKVLCQQLPGMSEKNTTCQSRQSVPWLPSQEFELGTSTIQVKTTTLHLCVLKPIMHFTHEQ
jgi:hypothetical protein